MKLEQVHLWYNHQQYHIIYFGRAIGDELGYIGGIINPNFNLVLHGVICATKSEEVRKLDAIEMARLYSNLDWNITTGFKQDLEITVDDILAKFGLWTDWHETITDLGYMMLKSKPEAR